MLQDIEKKEAAERAASNPAAPAVNGAAPHVGSELQQFAGIMSVVERFLPKSNPNDVTDLAKSVVATMRELKDGGGKSDVMETIILPLLLKLMDRGSDQGTNGILETFRQELADQRRQNQELIEKLATATQPKSLSDQLKDLMAAKEITTTLFRNPNRAPDPTDWPDVVARSIEKLVDKAPDYIQAYGLGKAGVPPTANRNPGAAGGAVEKRTPQTPEEKMNTIRQLSNQFGPMLDEATPIMVDQFLREMTGMHFRNWFLQTYGQRGYRAVRQMSVETIIAIIELRKQEAPEITRGQLAQLHPPDELTKFVKEFLSDDLTPEEQEDQPPQDQSAAAPTQQPGQEF